MQVLVCAKHESEHEHLRSGDPGNLWRKPFNMILLLFKNTARDKHREVGVLNLELLNMVVEPPWFDALISISRETNAGSL
jgi:hypothetical protein